LKCEDAYSFASQAIDANDVLIGEASEHDEIDPYSEKYTTADARARLSGLNHPEAK
jgi:hypothetical protein